MKEIGNIYGVSERTVRRWMDKYNIKRRSLSEAYFVKHKDVVRTTGSSNEGIMEARDTLKDIVESLGNIEPLKYTPRSRENVSVCIPLKALEAKDKLDATLTLALSDLHLGHENFLPETYMSTLETLDRILSYLTGVFNILRFNVVCVGDLVSGINVYKYQVFQNIIPRGHWQVFLAEIILKELLERLERKLPVYRVYLLRGTHESLGAENYMLYLRKALGDRAVYHSKHLLLNIAEPIGEYNVMFLHGSGKSQYYPFSYQLVRELWKTVAQYSSQGVTVEHIVTGHSHWLTPYLELEGLKLSQTGGFQLWEYSVHQRPSGMLLLLYTMGEMSVIPVRPNPDVEREEKASLSLEYRNMRFYAEKLLKHLESEPINSVK